MQIWGHEATALLVALAQDGGTEAARFAPDLMHEHQCTSFAFAGTCV